MGTEALDHEPVAPVWLAALSLIMCHSLTFPPPEHIAIGRLSSSTTFKHWFMSQPGPLLIPL